MAEAQPGALAPQRNRQPRERVNRGGARLDTAEVADQGMHTGVGKSGRQKLIGGMTDEFRVV